MDFRENVVLAINGLRANKMRALLTMLGIIIGISSVITIVTIGDAMTNSISGMLNEMGANSIQISLSTKPDEYGNKNYNYAYTNEDMISDEMLTQYREAFEGKIEAIAMSKPVGQGQALHERNSASGYLLGQNPDALAIQKLDIIAGHFINEREVTGAKSVAVISDKFIEELYPNLSAHDILGKEIKLRLSQGTYTFNVTGVYHYEATGFAASMTSSMTTNILIPITTAEKLLNAQDEGHWSVQIKASPEVTDTKVFATQTQDFFNKRFYRSNPNIELVAESLDSMIGQMTDIMGTMSIAIGIIAGISLLVGGIGVMNIMLVSVTERTREIGTRKALGAKNSAIRIQFIVESIIICLIGGAIGISLGTACGYFGSSLLGAAAFPSVAIVVIAVGFSMGIGIFFGYYPANKAAKLDPIEALRYE